MASIIDAEVLRAMESGTGEWTNVQTPVRGMLLTIARALEHSCSIAGNEKNRATSSGENFEPT